MKEVSHAVRRLIAIRPQCDRKGVLHGPGGCGLKSGLQSLLNGLPNGPAGHQASASVRTWAKSGSTADCGLTFDRSWRLLAHREVDRLGGISMRYRAALVLSIGLT